MFQLKTSILRFIKSDDGPTSVEYCVMIGFILLVCIAAITNIGTTTSGSFQRSYDNMS